MSNRSYGLGIAANTWHTCRDCIYEPEVTVSGNSVLRVMREISPGGPIEQVAYPVLTPEEARELGKRLIRAGCETCRGKGRVWDGSEEQEGASGPVGTCPDCLPPGEEAPRR